jgi:hypothetical protein
VKPLRATLLAEPFPGTVAQGVSLPKVREMNALIVGRNQRPPQISRLDLRGRSEWVATIFAAVDTSRNTKRPYTLSIRKDLESVQFQLGDRFLKIKQAELDPTTKNVLPHHKGRARKMLATSRRDFRETVRFLAQMGLPRIRRTLFADVHVRVPALR